MTGDEMTQLEMTVDKLTDQNDIETAAQLEKKLFDDPWSLSSIREYALSKTGCLLGVRVGEKIAGYAILQMIPGETEILRIAVETDYRRKGAATLMMQRIKQLANQNGDQKILLEVRSRNTHAIWFYEKERFLTNAVRKNYYTNPPDDAVLMSFFLSRS